MDKGGGEYQDFPSKILCLTVLKMKISVGESFTVALILGIENFWIGVGVYQEFMSKNLCLTVPKFSLGESFTVALFSGSEKIWIGGGVSRFSLETFMSHSAENIRRGVLYCCIISGIEKVWIKRRVCIMVFRRQLYVSQCRKFP